MNKIAQNIELITKIVQKHERYTHFSGTACILTGLIWVFNEALNLYFRFMPAIRIISWITVVILSVITAAFLTFHARQKEGKEKVTLSLLSVMEKLVFISIATLSLIYVFYSFNLIWEIPGLLLLMYGTLILLSKEHITDEIKYFGYLNVLGGVIALLYPQYAVPLTWVILGGGHIILGIVLIFLQKNE